MGILEKAKTIDEIPAWIKFCLYGPQGAGKTYLAASAPNPFWIDFERSTETLRAMPKEYHSIPIFKPTKMQEVFDLLPEFSKSDYQTLVLDTGTRMQFFQLTEDMQAVVRKNSSRDVYLPLFQEFRRSSEMLDSLFVKLQDMEKHVIIICHETYDYEGKEDERKLVKIRPDLTPAVAKKLNGLLNVTGYLESKPGLGTNPAKRVLTVNQSGKIVAKNRLGITATSIDNPTLQTLFARSYE